MSHPFEGWSAINEGWDSGAGISVNDILANLKTSARNFAGPVALALMLIWAVKALVSLAVGTFMIVGQVAGVGALFTVASIIGYAGIPLVIIIMLVQMSLYRPVQLQAFEGREFVGGIGDAFRLSKEVAGKVALTTLLYGLASAIGAIACLVGMLIPLFFFCQAPYLAATTELRPWECMRRSYELAKAYFMPVLAAIVASFGIAALLNGCGALIVGAIGGLVSQASPGAGYLIIALGGDLFGFLGACGLLVISGGLFTSIQSLERSIPFKN